MGGVKNKWKKVWKTGTLWASIVVVVAIGAAAIVIFTNPAGDPTANGQDGGAADPSHKAQGQGCDVPVGDTSGEPEVPNGLEWEAAEGWSWPVSDTYGPTQQKNGFGVCFARSPLGAALAMASVYGEGNTRDSKEAIRLYVAESPGKDEAIAVAGNLAEGSIGFAGFKVDSFTPQKAEITMVFSLPQSPTGYMGLPSTLVWSGDDWKVDLLNDGSAFVGQPTTPEPDDFVKWSEGRG